MRIASLLLIGCVAAAVSCTADGAVVEYQNRQAWLADAGPHTRITFQGFADNTIIMNQYADLGVLFTDGTDRIDFSENGYPNDNWGLKWRVG